MIYDQIPPEYTNVPIDRRVNAYPSGVDSILFAANSVKTLFRANPTVDKHRNVYANIKAMPLIEPLNYEEDINFGISNILSNREIVMPKNDLLSTYWDESIKYNPIEIFGMLIQFVDYHNSSIPKCVIPPESDVNRYINTILSKNSPVTVVEQLDELLTITNNNLIGAIHLGFVASRFIGRGMDNRAYPNILVTDKNMMKWGEKLAQFKLYKGKGDSTGDTYYFWTHVFAGLFYSVHDKNNFVFQKTFEYGTEIMVFVREWIAKLPTTSDHFEPSLLGRQIGLALAEPDWYINSNNNLNDIW